MRDPNQEQWTGTAPTAETIPSYCHPLFLFLCNWLLMLATLSVHVTYVSYPDFGLPFVVFGISLGSFLFGYLISKTLFGQPHLRVPTRFSLDLSALRTLNLIFCAVCILIIAFNWITLGPPPALGDPTSYLTYGRFRQVLFPVLTIIAVNGSIDRSWIFKLLFIGFSVLGLGIYITRGLLVISLLQIFFLFSLTTRMNRKRLYFIAFGCLSVLVAGVTIIGNLRTAQVVFFEFLQIREKYFDWPMASLWLTSYISIPLSNLCWMLHINHIHWPTLAFLYPVLPAFSTPIDPYLSIHNDLRIIDGASTYLEAYVLDFSYLGIYAANILLGAVSGWFVARGLSRQILASSIFLTCLSLICFSDMFTPLSTILQVLIQIAVQRRCFRWVQEAA